MRLADVKPGEAFRLAGDNPLIGPTIFIRVDNYVGIPANVVTTDGFIAIKMLWDTEVNVIGTVSIKLTDDARGDVFDEHYDLVKE